MALKRYKFHVNTSSSCFLCQKVIFHVHEDNLNRNSFSLKNIFQYLNIKINKIPTLSTKPVKIINKTDVRVSLCDKCQKTFEEISNLYRSMEVLKMKLDYKFELIHQKVKFSFDNNQIPLERFQTQMEKSTGEKSLRHSKLATELRKEILEKCNKEMPNYLPRVTLKIDNKILIRKATKTDETLEDLPSTLEISDEVIKIELASEILQDGSASSVDEDCTSQQHSLKQDSEDNNALDVRGDFDEPNFNDPEFNFQGEFSNNNSRSEAKQEILVDKSTCRTGKSESRKMVSQRNSPIFQSKKCSNKFYKKDAATGMFHCLKCDKVSKSYPGIYFHVNAFHFHKRYKCKTCAKDYRYQRDLTEHMKKCKQNLERRLAKEKDPRFKFVCKICGKRWDTEGGLSRHLRMVHRNAGRFPCDICNKKFASSSYLKKHKDAVHIGKKFTCGFCKRTFAITNIRKHEKLCQRKMKIKVEGMST